ncbi:hypothetical protein BU24DRAFT_417742 [Aaosphaeria arxii CBS 175.79]|uniref:Uncharacterized protein n=1 Tax=Aaosphaeria arxii CBS 175.79 TaxID=1450172 RepID=A0A6A5YBN0_9PLEO|nr:uncharacterized protein BU24DRAFT_417742 [Aaosphaeria arxii CBS 175.79]KAF2022090.1 hypothetical protein BU24DRAFT_417742 [Aaosphaeria arxii CBS 175.79]
MHAYVDRHDDDWGLQIVGGGLGCLLGDIGGVNAYQHSIGRVDLMPAMIVNIIEIVEQVDCRSFFVYNNQ